MGLGTFIFGLFTAGSAARCGMDNMKQKEEIYVLPNGMKYWIDRVGCFRDMFGRKIDIENMNDPEKLIITDIVSCRVIYDANASNKGNTKRKLLQLNTELTKKGEAENKKFIVRWIAPLTQACVINRFSGRPAIFIPVIEPDEPPIIPDGKITAYYAYYPRHVHCCGHQNGCPYDSNDYGTGEHCWCCNEKNANLLGDPFWSERVQELKQVEWYRDHCIKGGYDDPYPGLERIGNISRDDYEEDMKKVTQLAEKLRSFK